MAFFKTDFFKTDCAVYSWLWFTPPNAQPEPAAFRYQRWSIVLAATGFSASDAAGVLRHHP